MESFVADPVHDFTLLVEDVVVLEEAFADREIVLFDFFLCRLNGTVQQRVLELFAFLEGLLEDASDGASIGEEAHEVVFNRDKESGGAGVALARAASAQLAVDTARFVAFCTEDEESPTILDTVAQLNVCATTGHVCSYGDGSVLAGTGNDLSLFLVKLGVKNSVGDVVLAQHPAEVL